jgi:hypothetical protein
MVRLAVVRKWARRARVVDLDARSSALPSIRTDGLPIVARLGDDGDVFAMPRWSPDGTRLVVERRRLHGLSEIVVLNSDLSEALPPISSGGRNTTPDWTADGGRILFASDRDGGRGIAGMLPLEWSFDGREILATRQRPTGETEVVLLSALDGLAWIWICSRQSATQSLTVTRNPQPTMQQPVRQPATGNRSAITDQPSIW